MLLRAATDLPVYERALEERGLRTLAAVGSFWGHQQVGDLLAWLRALANPLDELALYSVLASPLVGISSDGLALVALQARAKAPARGRRSRAPRASSTPPLRHRPRAPGALRRALRRRARARRRRAASAELLLRAIAHSGYERHVLSLPWGERRLANIHKLLRLARRFEAAEGRDLRGFLDHVAQRRAHAESSEPHAPTGSEPDAVRLMTIHAAKGLEFPVVCLADLGRIGNGTPPDLLVDGERVGLRLARLDGSASVACLRYEELCEERRRSRVGRGGADPLRRDDPRPRAPAAERILRLQALVGRTGSAPISWLAPALVPELPALARTLERPVADLALSGGGAAGARCWLNSPATVGNVLR